MKYIFKTPFLAFLLLAGTLKSQVITREDSLNAGLVATDGTTVVSGYGQMKVQYDFRDKTASANLTRNVLFFGHRFSKKIYFFSEMEIEDAKIVGGEPSGEISMEQLFLKFNLNPRQYFTAGLFIPRIGIISENHLPNTFNGNDRPFVERFIIPATWREIGVGFYGSSTRIGGLNYSIALMNGLNAANFGGGEGIRDGRFEGSNATAGNIAVTGALLWYHKNWRVQMSGYYGGACGLNPRQADSLQLSSGPFGTPVALGEVNLQYLSKPFSFKALGVAVSIPDAPSINQAYANNTPSFMAGAYAEAAVNLLGLTEKTNTRRLNLFGRYEWLDMNAGIPENGIEDPRLQQHYVIAGVNYLPVRGVSIKADYVHRITGEPNPALWINPFPQTQPYYTSNGFFNLGLGYSF